MDLFFSFKGRIGRARFWFGYVSIFLLFLLVAMVLSLLEPTDQAAIRDAAGHKKAVLTIPQGILLVIYLMFSAWTTIAVCAKRFHDLGRSGWWYLIGLIPILGPLLLLIWLGVLPGDQGANAYGPPVVGAPQPT